MNEAVEKDWQTIAEDAVAVLGDAVRAHTRAIWTIKGEVEYPAPERAATGSRLGAELVRLQAEADRARKVRP